MKKLAPVFVILAALAAPAHAGPCVALDYQEMKDMSANDLVKEACKARRANEHNFSEYLLNVESGSRKPFPDADKNYDMCKGQIERIMRVVSSKGVTEKLSELCERQTKGEIITAGPVIKTGTE